MDMIQGPRMEALRARVEALKRVHLESSQEEENAKKKSRNVCKPFKTFLQKHAAAIHAIYKGQKEHPIDKANMPVAAIFKTAKGEPRWRLTREHRRRWSYVSGLPVLKTGTKQDRQRFSVQLFGYNIRGSLIGAPPSDCEFEDPRDCHEVACKIRDLYNVE